MKTFEEYLAVSRKITLKKWTDEDETFYVAQIPSLPGCVSDGYGVKEALKMIEEAKRGWIEMALERDAVIPKPDSEGFIVEYLGDYTEEEIRQCNEAAKEVFNKIEKFYENHKGVPHISDRRKKR